MNQRGGERQQTEGPTAEQHSAKHPAAGRQKKKKNLHHNSHNPQFLQQESLKEETDTDIQKPSLVDTKITNMCEIFYQTSFGFGACWSKFDNRYDLIPREIN